MGLFKSMKDLKDVTKQAKELQEQQQAQQGYKPGMAGQFQQMGDMLGQASQQMKDLTDQQSGNSELLATGERGQGVIVAMGTPERGAQMYNLDIDFEVHVGSKAPYRVANQYMVPAAAAIGPGVSLPIAVDREDPAKIAIDWENAARGPARGEVRPGGGAGAPAPPQSTVAATGAASGGGDPVADLERLAKLKESGALTEAEFEQQKAKILGG